MLLSVALRCFSLRSLSAKARAGQTTLSVVLDKIGLKDAQTYLNAFISVSLAASSGAVLESQDTPQATNLKPNYVVLGNTVHIQTTLEDILHRGMADLQQACRS